MITSWQRDAHERRAEARATLLEVGNERIERGAAVDPPAGLTRAVKWLWICASVIALS